jgi:DNA-binding LytR/AlgR family response regulator
MIRIAICDDEKIHRDKLREILWECETLPVDTHIFEFSNCSELIDSHMEKPHDIIFLDIQMDGLTGLEAAHEIRDSDSDVIIIFLTGFEQHVMQSFRVEAFDYIVKPADEKKISDVLKRAIRKYKDLHYIVNFKWRDEIYALNVSDIVYLESMRKKLKIITADLTEDDYETIGKLDDYDVHLQKYGFLRCHRSFLVNMLYIKKIDDTFIRTKLGHSVYMSTRKKQFCLQEFNSFITKYKVR